MNIILASKSPRRKEILKENGYQITIDISHANEHSIKEKDITKLVVAISELKAKTVAKRHSNAIIVAADTLVYFEGKEIGQPHDEKHAREMIMLLQNKTHEVYTGLTVINTATNKMFQDIDKSLVTFKPISQTELDKYIATGQYKDKAGAYNITDSEFKNFLEKIEGNVDNVMGLPFEKVDALIQKAIHSMKIGENMTETIKSKIRTVTNFPKQGIMFRDITTLLKDKKGFEELIELLVSRYKSTQIDAVAGIESRGFITGAVLAHRLKVGFIPIRKPGKLPAETICEEYQLEYGKDKVEVHKDAITKGMNILLVDDLIATGGTALAACNLISKLGGIIVECNFIVDLPDLGGKEKLEKAGYKVFSVVEFEGE